MSLMLKAAINRRTPKPHPSRVLMMCHRLTEFYFAVKPESLWQIILFDFQRRIFVRAAVDDRCLLKIAVRRRRGRGPFKRISMPGIALGPLTPKEAIEEVDQKDQLGRTQEERTDTDELVQ